MQLIMSFCMSLLSFIRPSSWSHSACVPFLRARGPIFQCPQENWDNGGELVFLLSDSSFIGLFRWLPFLSRTRHHNRGRPDGPAGVLAGPQAAAPVRLPHPLRRHVVHLLLRLLRRRRARAQGARRWAASGWRAVPLQGEKFLLIYHRSINHASIFNFKDGGLARSCAEDSAPWLGSRLLALRDSHIALAHRSGAYLSIKG